jgi:hypothetical protein
MKKHYIFIESCEGWLNLELGFILIQRSKSLAQGRSAQTNETLMDGSLMRIYLSSMAIIEEEAQEFLYCIYIWSWV